MLDTASDYPEQGDGHSRGSHRAEFGEAVRLRRTAGSWDFAGHRQRALPTHRQTLSESSTDQYLSIDARVPRGVCFAQTMHLVDEVLGALRRIPVLHQPCRLWLS